MNVLHTIPYFNKSSGGPTSCTYNLVKGLNKLGTPTEVLTFQPDKDDIVAFDDYIHYLPDDRKTPLWLSRNFICNLGGTISNYDIIHVNTIWTWPPHIAVREALKRNLPIVLSPHGMLYPQALKVSAWKKKIIGNLFVNNDLKSVSCIHATSQDEARHIRNYGINIPIAVIPNCINMDEYPPQRKMPNKARRFGFIGRLDPIKNIDLLLNAWESLGSETRNAELVLIGDGEPEYVNYLKAIINDNSLKNVRFCGFLSGKELKEAIHSLDYLVLPSKSENFGMVVAEALACGVPAITTKGTPWQSLVDENAGWWVDADIESISNAILVAINLNEKFRLKMGQNGYNLINRKYSASSIAKKMTKLYDWLLGNGNCPDFVIL